MSFDDMKGRLFSLAMSEAWCPYFPIRVTFRAGDLELAHLALEEEVRFDGATAQLSWRNAMGLIQYAHRCVHLMPAPQGLARLHRQREFRKDKPIPPTRLNASELQELWAVYREDADVPRLVPTSPNVCAVGMRPPQENARGRISHFESLMSKKCGSREALVERFGAYINPKAGTLWAGGGRIALSARLLGHVLSKVVPERKPLQVIGGPWIHVAGFRREISACFTQFWAYVSSGKDSLGPVWRQVLREATEALTLLPLAQLDLCALLVDFVVPIDASETGGSLCIATELTSLGNECLCFQIRVSRTYVWPRRFGHYHRR